MNRLTSYFEEAEEPEEPTTAESYYLVDTPQYWFAVSAETASWIEQQLERWWGPRWLIFTDLGGARGRIRRSDVDKISESTPAVRAAGRAFRRARKLEDKADRRAWEDDD